MKKLTLLSAFLLVLVSIQSSFAEVLIPGSCRMDYCSDSKFISKSKIQSNSVGTLYAIQTVSRFWKEGSAPPKKFNTDDKSYIYCSRIRPALIFKPDDDYFKGKYLAHLLNPGGAWFGYNRGDYQLYWITCHNFVGPDFFSEEMTERAIKLGYPLNLPSEQIELDSILDILN